MQLDEQLDIITQIHNNIIIIYYPILSSQNHGHFCFLQNLICYQALAVLI